MPIVTSRHDRTFVITLNRPEAMNSIDPEMFDQLTAAWDEFEHDDALFVAIVTGAGEKAFCAGRDLVKSAADSSADWSQRRSEGRLTPEGIWKPVIAAINGHCLAAGLALALGCDLRLATPNATFGTMAARRGIVAGGGQTQRLARYIPFAIAMEMILFGDRIDASEAYRVGLVNRIVPSGDLLPTAHEWARRLCENGPLALQAMKQAAYDGGLDMPLREGMRMEARLYTQVMKTEDAAEGQRAFAEKRPPQFKGR
ncbi:MAG: enoyl-CoA hydratase/isomerase family protein [Chloroflexi bacterium CFX7]|nr:MAG: enoyl-CoA hydratase/isomerase family protein [bacterium]MCE7927244.1 enoyl-CoA hydratase/isomerase family protein [Chloroflexi bacterium CFX7]MCK6564099.1 enoyl-CoA hydratase-related protein [Dehalococcoidia bacterium]MCL4230559.1 enoyl-CoA hydratase/isomerase family protein [Dehalococcoidia bacterium]